MKNIICYGDSNTFGYNPKDNSRFDEDIRWTAVLQKKLGKEYHVINEGMCNRTGFVDNPEGFLFSAQKHLPNMISEIDIVDILILAIGTNDLQAQYDISIEAIEKGLRNLIKSAKTKVKRIIVIPSVILSEKILEGFFKLQFNETSIEKSRKVGSLYRTMAKLNHCEIFDINEFAHPSEFDGLHYDKNSHKIIAEKLTEFIKKIEKNPIDQ